MSSEDEEAPKLSFFSADAADVSDSEEEKEKSESEDEEVAAPAKRVALPSLRELAAAPTNPAYLHRAAIYEVHELASFDNRAAPTAPKPWLKNEKKEAVVRNEKGEIFELRGVAEDIYRKRSSISAAEQVTAAAMCMSNSYKHVETEAKPSEQEPAFKMPAATKGPGKGPRDPDAPMSFREREKRKRDLGQQARDKSYVEEEKRLLRESGTSFGQGFD